MSPDILTLETYREMFSSIGEGVILLNSSGLIQKINAQAEQMLGIHEEQVTGQKLTDVTKLLSLDGKVVDAKERPFMHAMRQKQKIIFSGAYQRPDQTTVPARITVAPIIHQDRLLGTIAILVDITAELEAAKIKDEYISLVSHQLRTPLTSMQSYIEMLASKCANQNHDTDTCLESLHRINKNMVLLVNRLLNITRIESGRLNIEPESLNIVELIGEITSQYANKLADKKLKLTTRSDKHLPCITLDKSITALVIDNLITNAIKYSPEHSTIQISAVQTDHDIMIQVKDQGIGIPLKEQSKIFTKFYRASNTQENHTDGTGVGIYMTKKILDMTGGKIWFSSAQNQGTTFFVTFPLIGHKPKKGEVRLS